MTNTQHILHRTLDIGSGLILSIIIQIVVFPGSIYSLMYGAMFHLGSDIYSSRNHKKLFVVKICI